MRRKKTMKMSEIENHSEIRPLKKQTQQCGNLIGGEIVIELFYLCIYLYLFIYLFIFSFSFMEILLFKKSFVRVSHLKIQLLSFKFSRLNEEGKYTEMEH